MMKNVFYFTLKAIFVLELFQFLFGIFGHEDKRPDNNAEVNFKIYGIAK